MDIDVDQTWIMSTWVPLPLVILKLVTSLHSWCLKNIFLSWKMYAIWIKLMSKVSSIIFKVKIHTVTLSFICKKNI